MNFKQFAINIGIGVITLMAIRKIVDLVTSPEVVSPILPQSTTTETITEEASSDRPVEMEFIPQATTSSRQIVLRDFPATGIKAELLSRANQGLPPTLKGFRTW